MRTSETDKPSRRDLIREDVAMRTAEISARKPSSPPTPTLTEAWQKATRADRRAQILGTAEASQAAHDAWKAFNRMARTKEPAQ